MTLNQPWICSVCREPIEANNGHVRILHQHEISSAPRTVYVTHPNCDIPGVDTNAGYWFWLPTSLDQWTAWSIHMSAKIWFTKELWREFVVTYWHAHGQSAPHI